MLEVIGNHPANEVVVQLPRVERAYNRVSAFVERVQPALEKAKVFLQDLVCDCPPASTKSDTKSEVGMPGKVAKNSSTSAIEAVKCQ